MFEIKKILPTNFRAIYVLCAAAVLTVGCHAQQKTKVSPANNQPNAAATPVAAKTDSKIKFSSVYTKLDSKTCQPVGKAESEEDELPYICEGYGGYKIFVSTHGVATRIYVGREITADAESFDASTLPSFIANSALDGQTIEWRLADGEPFACIVRAEYDKSIINPDEKGKENALVVKSLKGFNPIEVSIDASKNKRANEDAQRTADAGYAKP